MVDEQRRTGGRVEMKIGEGIKKKKTMEKIDRKVEGA